ncbi:M81 family metallopeptidase [Candidatus Laterigemmans baculatus]|uniref:M81 family metallopeptidase n=1 Tax=Candidatus Laterigemmans baculatus TaxID=2770505 RepID=UPI0013D9A48E|nr:M81 family metallopeptidase [Candidatus Laterigemmans baculatus]
MRVGIIALLHESNTFISQPTRLEHFQQDLLLTGEAIRARMGETHHEVSGFFDGLKSAQIEAVPLFAARAIPFGPVTAEAFGELLTRMFESLDAAPQLDGVLIAPHGATVAENDRDADGYWIGELREQVGPEIPIIGTLDAHTNLSPQMVNLTDALIAYRTNPHLDQRARGVEAATLMARTLRGEIRPTQAAVFPPLAINIERQLTSEPHLVPLYEMADRMLEQPKVLSNSILLGFPYADVEEMGSSAIVVTNDDAALAGRLARQLGDAMWERRRDFVGEMISIDEALDRAANLDGPVCLLDMGDNIGGGSPADSTHLAHAIFRRLGNEGGTREAFVCLYDPMSVGQAAAAGVGAELAMRLGGKTDRLHGDPLEGTFRVAGLYKGKFSESQPRHGGFTHCDQGPTAVVRSDRGLTVMLTSERMPPFSLQQLISCGLDPKRFHLLVAKGVNAPVAAYAPVCPHLIRVNTPGCTTADMIRLDFQHRRRPMFPFEMDTSWE